LPNIKTVAILPFDNETPEPALTTEVATAVHQAIEGRLGLRPSGEQSADAVVRGRITRYDADLPLTYQSATGQPPNVTRRQVQITVDIAIVDQRDGKTLWQNQSLTVLGDYQPPSEAEGRKVALDKLVTEIVNGAQSQW
jgi:lipopolysaccharide assembly LptE-like protein